MRMNWGATLAYIASLLVASSQVAAYTTKDGKITTDSGKEIQLKGVNWFGFNTDSRVLHGLWSTDFKCHADRIKHLGFNAVRIPFTFAEIEDKTKPTNVNRGSCPKVNPDGTVSGQIPCNANVPGNGYDAFGYVIDYFTSIGLYVLPDNHYEDNAILNQDGWVASWKTLATRFKDNDMIIGWDLVNEPSSKGMRWDDATGGPAYGLAVVAVSDELMKIAPKKLIFIEGIAGEPIGANWGDGFATDPALVSRLGMSNPIKTFNTLLGKSYIDQIVLSPHVYGPDGTNGASNTQGSALWTRMQQSFGVLNDKGFCVNNGTCHAFPIAIGEFGGRFLSGGGAASDITTNVDLASYMNNDNRVSSYPHKPINDWFYWCWNPNSGNTGGLLKDDWQTLETVKFDYLYTIGLPNPNKVDPPAATTTPVTPPPSTATSVPTSTPSSGNGSGSSVTTITAPTSTPTPTQTPVPAPAAGKCEVVFTEQAAPSQWYQYSQYTFNITVPDACTGAGWNMTYTLPKAQKGPVSSIWNADLTINGSSASLVPSCSEKKPGCDYPWQKLNIDIGKIGYIIPANPSDRSVAGNTPTNVELSVRYTNGTVGTVKCNSTAVLLGA